MLNPHPFVVTSWAELHRSDLLALADRHRLGAQSRAEVPPRPPWPDLVTVMAVMGALAVGAVWLERR
jgi:hypothetical protein